MDEGQTMTETTPAFAAAATSGLVALSVSLLGVEPQALLYGAVGAVLGLSFAPEAPKLRAALTFTLVVLAGAALGTWAAVEWFTGLVAARNGMALALAAAFHPLLSSIVGKLPEIIDGVLRLARIKP